MTRITLWILSTLSVLVLLFGYHTSTVGAPAASAPPAAYSGTIAGTTGGSAAPPSPTTDDETSGSASESSGTSGTGSTGSGSTTSGASGTFTGTSTDTEWGPVQVAVTVADGTITDVQVPVYPSGNGKDEEINAYALPNLIQSTLEAQSADIDMVSGATVTSVGYEQSLQSALDQAGM